jgi:hypothetical protein
MATSGVLCPAPEVIGLWLLLLKVCHGTFHVSPGGRSSKPVAAPQARPKQFLTGNLPIADGTRASIAAPGYQAPARGGTRPGRSY